MKQQSLKEKVVVITGASSGFGRGAALRFAEHGASVVAAARREDLLQTVAAECEAAGGRALAVAADVSRPGDVERIARSAIEKFGRIDVWVNNAGVGALGRFERIPLEEHLQVIRTDLDGVLCGSWHAYRHFLQRQAGVLINIASELGAHSVPYYASYTAAKHGVVGLSDALRQEISAHKLTGIHVCTVMPTAHDTPFFDHAANHTGHEIQAPKPLHDPENVVETIVRLAVDPEDREIVGGDGVVKILMKKLVPPLQDKADAALMRRTQMDKAPPARDSSGAVLRPMAEGRDVSGHRLQAGR